MEEKGVHCVRVQFLGCVSVMMMMLECSCVCIYMYLMQCVIARMGMCDLLSVTEQALCAAAAADAGLV